VRMFKEPWKDKVGTELEGGVHRADRAMSLSTLTQN
jgi:hypothetical protein